MPGMEELGYARRHRLSLQLQHHLQGLVRLEARYKLNVRAFFQLLTLACQATPGAGSQPGQHPLVRALQWKLVLHRRFAKSPKITGRAHNLHTAGGRRFEGQAHTMSTPLLQQRLGGQVHILYAQCRITNHQALPDVISAPEQSKPNAKPRVLVKKNTSFEFAIMANQHRPTPAVGESVGRDEVFRFGGEIILLVTAPAKLEDLPQVRPQPSIPDNQLCGSWSCNKCGANSGVFPNRCDIQLSTSRNQLA